MTLPALRIDLATAPWTLKADADTAGPDPALRTARAAGVPATVPGCVHTDLLAAGLIEDPYGLDAESRLLWIAHTDWTHRTSFTLGADARNHDRLELACDGLDTVVALKLNGQQVGHAANMHRPHRLHPRRLPRAIPRQPP